MGTETVVQNKDNRIREAAARSHDTPPNEICRQLGIAYRTLKRYERDPRWKEYGGTDLPKYFTPAGRPRRDPDTDQQLATEAYRLHDLGMKWTQIAKQLRLTKRQLEYLRKKYQ